MKYEMFAIHDKKVGAYLPPFCARTKAEGIRMFQNWCSSDQMPFKAHPDDFDVYRIAEYDDESAGVFWEDKDSLVKLASATEFVKKS